MKFDLPNLVMIKFYFLVFAPMRAGREIHSRKGREVKETGMIRIALSTNNVEGRALLVVRRETNSCHAGREWSL